MKEGIYRHIEGKKVLLLFILTNVVYGFMLIFSIPKVMSYSSGMKIFDMMPMGYDLEYAYSLLEKLGIEGRHAYLYYQIPVDMIYPFLFGITYCLLLAYLLHKLDRFKNESFYLCLIPIIAGLFDYLENFGIIDMLVHYPELTDKVVQTATFFTVLKSLFSTISFIVVTALLVVMGFKKLFRKE
jgi:hypothetical protein